MQSQRVSPWPFAFTFLSLTAVFGLAGLTLRRYETPVAAEVTSAALGEGADKDHKDGGGAATALAPSATEVFGDLLEGNRRFVRGAMAPRPILGIREKLAQGQHPRVMVLGCSDSRVPPEIVFDKSLGDLFVVRTAGNIADPVALGSLEYATDHLHVGVLIVLGHEKCGAVAAAASGDAMPTPNLDAIVNRIRPALKTVDAGTPKDELALRQVEANVYRSARNLLEESSVMREAVEKGELSVFKGVYHLETGEVKKLK